MRWIALTDQVHACTCKTSVLLLLIIPINTTWTVMLPEWTKFGSNDELKRFISDNWYFALHFSVIYSPKSGLIWLSLVHANSPSIKYNPCLLLLIISVYGLHNNYLCHHIIIFPFVSCSLNGSCLGYGNWNQGIVTKQKSNTQVYLITHITLSS